MGAFIICYIHKGKGFSAFVKCGDTLFPTKKKYNPPFVFLCTILLILIYTYLMVLLS